MEKEHISVAPKYLQKNMKVWRVSHSEIREWLLYKHYAHRVPSVSFAFGLYEGNVMQGVCTFGVPASPALVKGAFGGEYASCFYELNRLVVNDGLPKNTLSWFVARCLEMMPRPSVIVSYADSGMGHHGYIYQATNWTYTGLSDAHKEYKLGETNSHSRHLFDAYGGINNAKAQGVEMEVGERSRKHRYFYFLGNRREKKRMRSLLKYKVEVYPKGENQTYDASFAPHIQLTLF